MKAQCDFCKKTFDIYPYKIKRQKNIFCSTICQYSFKKRREQLVCEICGNKFEIQKSRIKNQKKCFCSKKCADIALIKPRIERKCKNCGNKFEILKSRLKHAGCNYCSVECFKKARIKEHNRKCLKCGKQIFVNDSKIKNSRGKFCSRKCFNDFQTGETSNKFIHGEGIFRKKVSKNRKSFCKICKKVGKTEVHHIDGNHFNNKENFITVCRACHTRIHSISGKFSIPIKKSLKIISLIADLPYSAPSTQNLIQKLKNLSLEPLETPLAQSDQLVPEPFDQ